MPPLRLVSMAILHCAPAHVSTIDLNALPPLQKGPSCLQMRVQTIVTVGGGSAKDSCRIFRVDRRGPHERIRGDIWHAVS